MSVVVGSPGFTISSANGNPPLKKVARDPLKKREIKMSNTWKEWLLKYKLSRRTWLTPKIRRSI
jgi:hypothetical protein